MSVHTSIEIAAPPEEVRRIFLEFQDWHLIQDDTIRSISRVLPSDNAPVQSGDKLEIDFAGYKVITTENTPEKFIWQANVLVVLGGVHTFRFEPSKTTPGGTTFVSEEVFSRANAVLMWLFPPRAKFEATNEAFKKRVEGEWKGGVGGSSLG